MTLKLYALYNLRMLIITLCCQPQFVLCDVMGKAVKLWY